MQRLIVKMIKIMATKKNIITFIAGLFNSK